MRDELDKAANALMDWLGKRIVTNSLLFFILMELTDKF